MDRGTGRRKDRRTNPQRDARAHLRTLLNPFPFVNISLEPSFSWFQECISDGQMDRQTDGQTYGRRDKVNYNGASLLKTVIMIRMKN